MEADIIAKMIGLSPAFGVMLWLLLQARADVKEERAKNQALVETILKITADRVSDAHGRNP